MSRSHFVFRRARSGRGFWFPAVRLAAIGLVLGMSAVAGAQTVSVNTGSLGAVANGTNAAAVTFGPGAITAGGDITAVYDGAAGTTTTVPFNASLNPAAANPFSIEFWARPTAWDNDDAPVSNRIASGNRSGWAFFQRDAGTGWNFRMYNGAGSALGWDLTGGTATLDSWSHVVATWNGSAAALYVNGVLADNVNESGLNGVYNPNTSTASLILAASDTGSPYTGTIDETAFYTTALTPAQIAAHYAEAASVNAGAYHTLVRNDGALLQLTNPVPEPATVLSVSAATLLLGRWVSRRRKRFLANGVT